MKKLLLIGLILVVCMLAFPQGVMAVNTANTATVDATVKTFAKIDATFNGPWELKRGANNLDNGITVTVDSNTPWTTKAEDLTNSGYLTPTVGAALTAPLYIKGGALTSAVDLETAGLPQASTPLSYDLDQAVDNDDDANVAYHMTITFTLTTP